MDHVWVTGHRVVDLPVQVVNRGTVPNTEVKHDSVFGGSVVFGHAKPRKLVAQA